jgi:Na+/phosphate symporter
LERRPQDEPEDDADALRIAGERLAEAYLPEKELLRIDWPSVSKKVLLAVLGIFTFVLGVQLMKASAQGLAPALEPFFGAIFVSPATALGFGWGVTYLVLSGSPVAAVALGLLDAGVLDTSSAYFMIMGSRFGASFIVIVIGLVAIARGGGREESLSMGVLSFLVTYSIYVPALLMGFMILSTDSLGRLTVGAPLPLLEGVSILYGPIVEEALLAFPLGLVFILSFISLYGGLSLFDRAFHRKEMEEVEVSAIHRLLEVPFFSFILGAGITLLSTSVSLSLGMLVPLYLKGYLRRRDVVPYIMGANITTFVDTLLVAFLLSNPLATHLVLVAMLSVATVSLVALLLYRYYSQAILWVFHWTFHSNRALAGFVVLLAAVPLALLVL